MAIPTIRVRCTGATRTRAATTTAPAQFTITFEPVVMDPPQKLVPKAIPLELVTTDADTIDEFVVNQEYELPMAVAAPLP